MQPLRQKSQRCSRLLSSSSLRPCRTITNYDTQAIAVEVTTVEDAWAVRLMDMLTGLHQLQVEGMTREMYIWGNVQVQHVLLPESKY